MPDPDNAAYAQPENFWYTRATIDDRVGCTPNTRCSQCPPSGDCDSCGTIDGRFMDEVNEYASTCDGCAELASHDTMLMNEDTQLGYCPQCAQKLFSEIQSLRQQLAEAQDDIKYLLEVISHHESQQFNTHQMYYDRVHRIRGTRDKGEG